MDEAELAKRESGYYEDKKRRKLAYLATLPAGTLVGVEYLEEVTGVISDYELYVTVLGPIKTMMPIDTTLEVSEAERAIEPSLRTIPVPSMTFQIKKDDKGNRYLVKTSNPGEVDLDYDIQSLRARAEMVEGIKTEDLAISVQNLRDARALLMEKRKRRSHGTE